MPSVGTVASSKDDSCHSRGGTLQVAPVPAARKVGEACNMDSHIQRLCQTAMVRILGVER